MATKDGPPPLFHLLASTALTVAVGFGTWALTRTEQLSRQVAALETTLREVVHYKDMPQLMRDHLIMAPETKRRFELLERLCCPAALRVPDDDVEDGE